MYPLPVCVAASLVCVTAFSTGSWTIFTTPSSVSDGLCLLYTCRSRRSKNITTISSNSVSRSTAMSASSTTKLATMMGWLFKIEPVTVSAVEETVVLMDIV